MPSINNLSNNYFQRPTFSDVIISTVHHLGNVRNYNSRVSSADHFSFMISSLSKQTSLEMVSISFAIYQLVET